jgi:hypothetical protein
MMLLAEPLRQLDLMSRLAYHRTNINLQLSKDSWSLSFAAHPPVSKGRFRTNGSHPNQCTRIAIARFYNGYVLAQKWVIVATLANPQSRDFKR